MRALFTLLLLSASAGTALAGDNEVTIGTHYRSLRSDSANALTTENLGAGSFQVARQLPFVLYPKLQLWATGALSLGGAEGLLFQRMATEIDMLGFAFGGRARYMLHRNLAVTARLDVGTARDSLTIYGNGHTASDAAWGGTSSGSLGVDVLAIAYPAFSLGVRFEYGYLTATAAELSPAQEASETMIELDAMQASIGHLDLGGRYFSFQVLGQF